MGRSRQFVYQSLFCKQFRDIRQMCRVFFQLNNQTGNNLKHIRRVAHVPHFRNTRHLCAFFLRVFTICIYNSLNSILNIYNQNGFNGSRMIISTDSHEQQASILTNFDRLLIHSTEQNGIFSNKPNGGHASGQNR